jgi:GNAT superfamily N-acetyltransferase
MTTTCRTRSTVRRAPRDDHDAIKDVIRAAYGQYAAVLGPELYSRYLADLIDLDRHAQHGDLYVAEHDGVIVGSAAFYPDARPLGWPGGWASGRGLAVLPSARGLGVATAILGLIERLACQTGARVFAFHTSEFMTDAVALYGRLGFRRAPRFDIDFGTIYGVATPRPLRSIAFYRNVANSASQVSSVIDESLAGVPGSET